MEVVCAEKGGEEKADEMGERGGRTLIMAAPRESESVVALCVFEACARTWRERTVCVVVFCAAVGAAVGSGPRAPLCVLCVEFVIANRIVLFA